MNAHQRKKDRRLWRYSIITVAHDWDHYNAMWEWLKNKHGINVNRCGWRDRIVNRHYCNQDDYQVIWEFVNEKNAIEFALRWA